MDSLLYFMLVIIELNWVFHLICTQRPTSYFSKKCKLWKCVLVILDFFPTKISSQMKKKFLHKSFPSTSGIIKIMYLGVSCIPHYTQFCALCRMCSKCATIFSPILVYDKGVRCARKRPTITFHLSFLQTQKYYYKIY